ncbi:hypothetical protein L596_001132 [Steinernema carpocapsae]|uniref:Uncharacterized protein n=1 Tax=Steinernema carpocapsae TaxID=34508 RepID=A0A4U8UKD7_STECR|nr:hypothetical protein L596_001132 [Steinernema carpocapsae]
MPETSDILQSYLKQQVQQIRQNFPDLVNLLSSFCAPPDDLRVAIRMFMNCLASIYDEEIISQQFEYVSKMHNNAQIWMANVVNQYPQFYRWDLTGINVAEELPPHLAHVWKEILKKIEEKLPEITDSAALNLWKHIREAHLRGESRPYLTCRLGYLSRINARPQLKAKEYSGDFWPLLFDLCGQFENFYSRELVERTVPQELNIYWEAIIATLKVKFPKVWKFMRKVYLTSECPEKYRGRLPFLDPHKGQTISSVPLKPKIRDMGAALMQEMIPYSDLMEKMLANVNRVEDLSHDMRALWEQMLADLQEKLPNVVASSLIFFPLWKQTISNGSLRDLPESRCARSSVSTGPEASKIGPLQASVPLPKATSVCTPHDQPHPLINSHVSETPLDGSNISSKSVAPDIDPLQTSLSHTPQATSSRASYEQVAMQAQPFLFQPQLSPSVFPGSSVSLGSVVPESGSLQSSLVHLQTATSLQNSYDPVAMQNPLTEFGFAGSSVFTGSVSSEMASMQSFLPYLPLVSSMYPSYNPVAMQTFPTLPKQPASVFPGSSVGAVAPEINPVWSSLPRLSNAASLYPSYNSVAMQPFSMLPQQPEPVFAGSGLAATEITRPQSSLHAPVGPAFMPMNPTGFRFNPYSSS